MTDSPEQKRNSILLVMLAVGGWIVLLAGGVASRVWSTSGSWLRAALGALVVLCVGGVFLGLWLLLLRKFRRRR